MLSHKKSIFTYIIYLIMEEILLTRPEIIWFIGSLILFVLELTTPGFVLFFFGVGACITALFCMIFPSMGFPMQVVIFLTISIISLITLRKFIKNKFFDSSDKKVKDADDDFIGQTATASVNFNAGTQGKIEYRGTQWQALSDSDIKAGEEVVIIGRDNTKLIVKPK